MTETSERIMDAERRAAAPAGLRGDRRQADRGRGPGAVRVASITTSPAARRSSGAEAIRRSGALYELLIPAVFDPAPDLVSAVRLFFAGAAAHLEDSRVRGRLPDRHRRAGGVQHAETDARGLRRRVRELDRRRPAALHRAGLDEATSRELVIGMIAALEGAFVLAARRAEHRGAAGRRRAHRASGAARAGPPVTLRRPARQRDQSVAHAPAAGARLGGRPARRGDPQHPHRLEPERQLLAPVGGGDVEAGQLADALEAVADRVAVGDQPRRRWR